MSADAGSGSARGRPGGRSRVPLRVGAKFSAAVGVILVAALVIVSIGVLGLIRIKSDLDKIVSENVSTLEALTQLEDSLHHLADTALQQITVGAAAAESDRLDSQIDGTLIPETIRRMDSTRRLLGNDSSAGSRLDQIEAGLDAYQALRRTGGYRRVAADPRSLQADADLARRTVHLFDRLTTVSDDLRESELQQLASVADRFRRTYFATLGAMAAGVAAILAAGLTIVTLLNRNLVPRITAYARFAGEISAGRSVSALDVQGGDELADLGRALNQMVRHGEQVRTAEENQSEFIIALQVTATEDEAHDLLQRHLERALPSATVTVLRRNNSQNRLEPATDPTRPEADVNRLSGAEPRSCLAIRYNRTHREGDDRRPLRSCTVCSATGGRSTCEPLLVGGELIGSVLAEHPNPLSSEDSALIAGAVAQAAPVLANLRNLALADFRANNDALTGLPNRRASEDTLKRMVAQANRSVTPLTAVMLDLDHFKLINDRHGHGKGDEVLAAVGAVFTTTLRASDFAGRYGGEEFLILLPETGAQFGLQLAEKLREAIRAITIDGVDQQISASLGVADLFEHGGVAAVLVREADRALYAAKAAGRDCTILASSSRAERNQSPSSATNPVVPNPS